MDKLNDNKSFIPNTLDIKTDKKIIVNFVPVNYIPNNCNSYLDTLKIIKSYFDYAFSGNSPMFNSQQELNLKLIDLLTYTTFPNFISYYNSIRNNNSNFGANGVIHDNTHDICEEKFETITKLLMYIKQKISFAQIDVIYTHGSNINSLEVAEFEKQGIAKLTEKMKEYITPEELKTINFRSLSETINSFSEKKESHFYVFLNISLSSKEVGEFYNCIFNSYKEDPINFFIYQLFIE